MGEHVASSAEFPHFPYAQEDHERARRIGHHTSERDSGAMSVPRASLEQSAVIASPTKGKGENTQFTRRRLQILRL